MTGLSVALVGAGNIAGGFDERRLSGERGIYSHAGAYKETGDFVLKTVFDMDAHRAAAFRDTWGAERVAPDLEAVCATFHDVVSVCTPDDTHARIVRTLLERRCCRTIFVEKPIAPALEEIAAIDDLAGRAGTNVIVNFQRRNEASHNAVRERLAATAGGVLAAGGYYIKGLRHIGVTMIDTLLFMLGRPEAVLSYNRVLNEEARDYSYEFVLFYSGFNVAVRTTDVERFRYCYHLFEIDVLLADGRLTFVDNSRAIREVAPGGYAYAGVKVLKDREASCIDTGFPRAMVAAAEYVRDVTTGVRPHTINTVGESYNNALVMDRVVASYEQQAARLAFEQTQWKK